jgi:hypothetical protein
MSLFIIPPAAMSSADMRILNPAVIIINIPVTILHTSVTILNPFSDNIEPCRENKEAYSDKNDRPPR